MPTHKSHFSHLKSKWLKKHQVLHKKLWTKHKSALEWLHRSSYHTVVGTMASVFMMSHPGTTGVLAQNIPLINIVPTPQNQRPARTPSQLIADLADLLPPTVQPLTVDQEQTIATKLNEYFGIYTTAELNGIRLNRSYGLIGAEQHLMRYPGDTMATHFSTQEEQKYYASGMAPGRGAWGYFVPSYEQLTQRDIDREKYYLAVQTFLAPGWNENTKKLSEFFKYRKMLAVNPENGKAMVVVIADAGPAEFTGKHLGGSPEVMSYLERVDGAGKGPVIYFFIDDPEDKIPLGPIAIQ